MKNRYFYSIVLVLTGAVLFGACNKDEQFIDMDARIVTYGDNGSKVYVDAPSANWTARYANWHNNDKVKINNEEYTVEMRAIEGVNCASISDVQTSPNGYFAIYPSDRVISYSVNTDNTQSYRILLPQVQIYDNSRDGHQLINAPMAAYCPARRDGTHSLDFKNLCSLIEVDVPVGKEVAYINVTSDNRFLWGEATVTTSMAERATPTLTLDENGTIQSDYNTSNYTVTLDCTTNGSNGSNNNGGGYAASGHKTTATDHLFYVVVPADSYTNLKVEVYVFDETETASAVLSRGVKRYTYSGTSTSVAGNKIYSVVCDNDDLSSDPVQPEYPGLGKGEFSVGYSQTGQYKKVRFSQGNLQYLASKDMWSFASNQWDFIGNNAGNTTETNRDRQPEWIDLFGYGTSNYTTTTASYSPTQTSSSGNYGPATGNIKGTDYDWGVNEISNGGNQPNKWRTLTQEEWQYLIGVRNDNGPTGMRHPRYGKQGLATITVGTTQYKGFVLMPDGNWTLPNGFCSITSDQWTTMRRNGCIFLPCSGYRNGTTVSFYESFEGSNVEDGFYWSSTSDGSTNARCFKLSRTSNNAGGEVSCLRRTRNLGYAVRLVRDVD